MKTRDASAIVYGMTHSHPITDELLFVAYSTGHAYSTTFAIHHDSHGYEITEY